MRMEKIRTVFIGYQDSEDLAYKHHVLFEQLNNQGCQLVQLDGDLLHVIADSAPNEHIQALVDRANDENGLSLTTEFQTIERQRFAPEYIQLSDRQHKALDTLAHAFYLLSDCWTDELGHHLADKGFLPQRDLTEAYHDLLDITTHRKIEP